jgi:hypothetical protein
MFVEERCGKLLRQLNERGENVVFDWVGTLGREREESFGRIGVS